MKNRKIKIISFTLCLMTSPLYNSLPRINCAGAKFLVADRFSRRTASSMF